MPTSSAFSVRMLAGALDEFRPRATWPSGIIAAIVIGTSTSRAIARGSVRSSRG